MTTRTPRKLILWIHEKTQMALLKHGTEEMCFGNYWDFHAGCSGTKMILEGGKVIDFKKEWTEDIRYPHAVAEMVSKKLGIPYCTKYRKTHFDGCP